MAFGLLLVAVVLGLLGAKLRIPSSLSVVLLVSAGISAAIGIVLGVLAKAEYNF
jgi:hypothetical protein